MRAAGYDLVPDIATPTERVRFYASVLPVESCRLCAWLVTDWIRRRRGVPVSEPKHAEPA